jgi:hypothetical protein
MVCRENTIDSLLAELAVHRIDLVIADYGNKRKLKLEC